MSKRSFEILDFADVDPKLFIPLPHQVNSVERMRAIEQWLEPRAHDEYLVLMTTVMFKNEKDAMLFKLGFEFHDSQS